MIAAPKVTAADKNPSGMPTPLQLAREIILARRALGVALKAQLCAVQMEKQMERELKAKEAEVIKTKGTLLGSNDTERKATLTKETKAEAERLAVAKDKRLDADAEVNIAKNAVSLAEELIEIAKLDVQNQMLGK